MTYSIKSIECTDMKVFRVFYEWKKKEHEFEKFSCRPIKPIDAFDEYLTTMKKVIESGNKIYYLENSQEEILGRAVLFDLNPRNKSGEIGYYFPKYNRGKGYGTILLQFFINEVFESEELNLNKIYATTASGNKGSIKMLKRHNFSLDGVMREHYWMKERFEDQHCYSLLRREWEVHLCNLTSGYTKST